MNKFLVIANWKMFLTFDEEIEWINKNLIELKNINDQKNEIIICPSFLSIAAISNILKDNIKIGAQNCSSFQVGAYTSQISAKSLSQLNCKYCIVGHSESRKYFHESDSEISQKVKLLLHEKITPIICIGETKQEYEEQKSKEIIAKQLILIIETITNEKNLNGEIIIAYEPISSIGTGVVPSIEYIDSICQYIDGLLKNIKIKYRIIYGGSVSPQTASDLKKSKFLRGFLIGKASTDFQELKKIVLS